MDNKNSLADEWDFSGFLPDADDIDASLKSMDIFFDLPPITFESQAAMEVHIFHAAFYRGIAWAKFKEEKSR